MAGKCIMKRTLWGRSLSSAYTSLEIVSYFSQGLEIISSCA